MMCVQGGPGNGTSFCVMVYTSYKALKTVWLLAHPVHNVFKYCIVTVVVE